jgi:hypothetical protein
MEVEAPAAVKTKKRKAPPAVAVADVAGPAVSDGAPSAASDVGVRSSNGVSPELACHIRSFLRSQSDLYVRLLLFQPLDIVEVAFLLQDVGGVKVHPKLLRTFLDEEGICTSWNMEGARRGQPMQDEDAQPCRKARKGAAHKPRKNWTKKRR